MKGTHAQAYVAPYCLATAIVIRREVLSPSFIRFTFAGEGPTQWRTLAPDQRIKVFFPQTSDQTALEGGADWYAQYKSRPVEARPAMRTYTIRNLRQTPHELDVDFVVHGDSGPGTRWALAAQPGACLQIAAPNAAYEGDPGGYEWRPPSRLDRLVILGDETALPAIAGILERLADSGLCLAADVLIEVPVPDDCLQLACWPGLKVQWFCRSVSPGHLPGLQLIAALRALSLPKMIVSAEPLRPVDVDRDILWETAPTSPGGLYVWAAGEAQAMLEIRRFLRLERGIDPSSINVMGYWRLGRTLD